MADPDLCLSLGFTIDHLGQPTTRPGQWCCLLIRDGEHYRGYGPTWREAMTNALHDPDPITPVYAEDLQSQFAQDVDCDPKPINLRNLLASLRPAKTLPTFKGRL